MAANKECSRRQSPPSKHSNSTRIYKEKEKEEEKEGEKEKEVEGQEEEGGRGR